MEQLPVQPVFWHNLASFFAFFLLLVSVLPFFGTRLLAAYPELQEKGLGFTDKLLIFLLFVIAAILEILALVFAEIAVVLAVLAAFFLLLATFWWLFEHMIWPWDPRFWKIFFAHPWLAWLLGLLWIIPIALLIAILLFGVTAAGTLLLIALIIALWWLIFVWRCGWITWVETRVKRVWKAIERSYRWAQTVVQKVIKTVQRWVKQRRQEWRTIRRRRCASWRWWLRWICSGFTYVMETILVVVEILVLVTISLVFLVLITIWIIVTLIVIIVLYILVVIVKTVFLCW
ncbi:MAG: hypothetical protein ACE5ED_13015 [Rhodothalassiaceae bacterium]